MIEPHDEVHGFGKTGGALGEKVFFAYVAYSPQIPRT